MKDLDTIRATVKRLKEDGTPVAEYALRQWVKTGLVPSVKCGQKSLVNYQKIKDFIGVKQEYEKSADLANKVEQEEQDIRDLEKYTTEALIAEVLLRIGRCKKYLRETEKEDKPK